MAFPWIGAGGTGGGYRQPSGLLSRDPLPSSSHTHPSPSALLLGPSIHIKKPKATQLKDSGSQMDETPFQEQEVKRLIGEFPAREDMSSLEQR